ncbi:MAG TPA: hypothetical protein VK623_09370 [Flavobacterium sp.]|nr:hypothetical protein [Flavobacterium sp.]
MEADKFSELKIEVQEIIDMIAAKQFQNAIIKLTEASDLLDDLLDVSADDDDLIEISKYQVLLNHLQQKIHSSS